MLINPLPIFDLSTIKQQTSADIKLERLKKRFLKELENQEHVETPTDYLTRRFPDYLSE